MDSTSVHLLRADAAPEAPPDAPAQLLIPPMAAGATYWLETMGALTAHGPVVAPDLPGNGRTVPPDRAAATVPRQADCLQRLVTTLGLDRVAVHGWSMGALIAVLLADRAPSSVARLVLVGPMLPWPQSRLSRFGWQTAGRAALTAVPTAAGVAIRSSRVRKRKLHRESQVRKLQRLAGPGPAPFAPEFAELSEEDRRTALVSQPWRLRAAVTAGASVVRELRLRPRPIEAAIDRITAPTMLMWGRHDPLCDETVIDHLRARRPDWPRHTAETAGHLPPLEVPAEYARAVADWYARTPL